MMRWLERNWESLCMEALSTALQWERMYKGLSRTIFRRFSSSRTTSQLSLPVSVLTFLFRREPFRSKTCKWRTALLCSVVLWNERLQHTQLQCLRRQHDKATLSFSAGGNQLTKNIFVLQKLKFPEWRVACKPTWKLWHLKSQVLGKLFH